MRELFQLWILSQKISETYRRAVQSRKEPELSRATAHALPAFCGSEDTRQLCGNYFHEYSSGYYYNNTNRQGQIHSGCSS
jgi:hypothetical protein